MKRIAFVLVASLMCVGGIAIGNGMAQQPFAENRSVTTVQGTSQQTITLQATDIDSPSLTFLIHTSPSNGVLSPINAPLCIPRGPAGFRCVATVTYTPDTDFNGLDSFTFTASDGTHSSNPATVSITVSPLAVTLVLDKTTYLSGDDPITFTLVLTNKSGEEIITTRGLSASLFHLSLTFIDPDGKPIPLIDLGRIANEPLAPPALFIDTGVTFNGQPALQSFEVEPVELLPATVNGDPRILSVTGQAQTFYSFAAHGVGNYTVKAIIPVRFYPGIFQNSGGVDYAQLESGVGGTIESNIVRFRVLNSKPSFSKGSNVMVLEDAGPQTVSPWATAISPGAANEAGQTVNFLITNNTNQSLFATGPAVSPTGVLTFTPATNANGVATLTLVAKDNGGTDSGGQDTSDAQTFTITVTPVNDPPSFTKGPNITGSANAGAQTVANWATAISAGPANESGQALNFIVTNNNNALFSVPPAVMANGTLTYTAAANANGVATVAVKLHDDGGTANMGVDTSAEQTFTITVTPTPRQLASLGPAKSWIGLKNSDDQGTQYDLRVEVSIKNAQQVTKQVLVGQTRCITGVTSNANQAKLVTVAFPSFTPVDVAANDVLSLTILTRIGTNPDDTKCAGPGGSHNSAVGLRLYYDATSRQSGVTAALTPNPPKDFFLHSSGTSNFLDATAPMATTAKYKDSAAVNFSGGNLWKAIGTWSMTLPPP